MKLVLLVDDEEDFHELGDLHLGRAGYRIVHAVGGRAGIDTLHGGLRPAVIVLDLQMPDVSGWQVWDWLRTSLDHRHIPVVFWTGSGLQQGAMGLARIVAKGDMAQLIEAVHSVVN